MNTFKYKSIMCYHNGNYYVLCDEKLWPAGRSQVSIPKKLHKIGKLEGIDQDGNKYNYYFTKKLKNSNKFNLPLVIDLIDNYNNGKFHDFIKSCKKTKKPKPKWETNQASKELVNFKAKSEKIINEKFDLSILTSSNYEAIKWLKKTVRNYNLNGHEYLTMTFGSKYLPNGAQEYEIVEYMYDVNEILIRLSKREYVFKLSYHDRNMSTKDFINKRLIEIFSTLDLAGDKLGIRSLDERDFVIKKLPLIAKFFNISLPDENIKFEWSSIGDKIVYKKVKERYKGLVSKSEISRIVSNANMANTLKNIDENNKFGLKDINDVHELGTLFETLIYVCYVSQDNSNLDMLITKLIKTQRNW